MKQRSAVFVWFMLGLVATCLCGSAYATGIVSSYWVSVGGSSENPLVLCPGGSATGFFFSAQNPADQGEDLVLRVWFVDNADIAFLVDATPSEPQPLYYLPSGIGVNIPVTVSLPDDAIVGTRYIVTTDFLFTPTAQSGGLFGGVEFQEQFPVLVVANPNAPVPDIGPSALLVLIGLAAQVFAGRFGLKSTARA